MRDVLAAKRCGLSHRPVVFVYLRARAKELSLYDFSIRHRDVLHSRQRAKRSCWVISRKLSRGCLVSPLIKKTAPEALLRMAFRVATQSKSTHCLGQHSLSVRSQPSYPKYASGYPRHTLLPRRT